MHERPRPGPNQRRTSAACILSVLLLQVGYVLGVAIGPSPYFGFNQLRPLGLPITVCALATAWLLALRSSRRPASSAVGSSHERSGSRARSLAAVGFALAGIALFLVFRTHAFNPDGVALSEKIPEAVARHGAYVTHDEMLEFYIHSRVYAAAHTLLRWSVTETYQVVSALAGGVFLLLLASLARWVSGRSSTRLIALVLAGGYVQLFFGDVENYTMVVVVILLYVMAAYRHTQGRAPLWLPAGALSLAMAFHLLAGWLLPSLVYLYWVAMRRGERRGLVSATAALVVPITGLVAFLNFHGLPIQRLFDSSHAFAMGGQYARYIAPLNERYFGGILNLLVLLVPLIVLLPALILFRRLGSDSFSRFLQVASLSMLVFALVWRAQLGVHEDWNLFAPGMIPVAILISASMVTSREHSGAWVAAKAAALTGALSTAMWILSNSYGWS